MLRLIVPLAILTLVIWAAMYALPVAMRKKSFTAARKFAVAMGLAVVILGAVSAIFYFGGMVNAN